MATPAWMTMGMPPPPGAQNFQTLGGTYGGGAALDQVTPRYGAGGSAPRGMEYDWSRPAYGSGVGGGTPKPPYGAGGYPGGAGGAPVAPGVGGPPGAQDAAYKRYMALLMNPGQAFEDPAYKAILQQGVDAQGRSAAMSRLRYSGKSAQDFQTLGQRTAAGYLGQVAGQYAGGAGEERARNAQTLSAWQAQQQAEQQQYLRLLSEWSNYTGIQAR